jgi:hypothetical protein
MVAVVDVSDILTPFALPNTLTVAGIHRRPAASRVERGDQLPDEREVEALLQPTVEVVLWDEVFQGYVLGQRRARPPIAIRAKELTGGADPRLAEGEESGARRRGAWRRVAPTRPGSPIGPRLFSCPYSPECLEERFSEVRCSKRLIGSSVKHSTTAC